MDVKPLITMEEATEVVSFWFDELEPQQWFKPDDGLDNIIRSRFGAVHQAAANGELWPWRATPHGRLAEIIVLDQFSRNIHRHTPAAYRCDLAALLLAQEAVAAGADQALTVQEVTFLYMPFMHSESLDVHDIALELFDVAGLEKQMDFEVRHRDVLVKFGRYPQRNEAMGRSSTPEEKAFLASSETHF
ncbi:DUF924 family protein [Salinimonas chungwhensis]|uniref:DUF924 family protein n=1 Tax=Salinimonas chungwhensis TaxID=265425 RepID=UPI00036B69C3|nr:DUF924 family protein [Salinimonas chungwhensis]